MILPTVVLWHPKLANNIGSTLRAAACFGIKQVWAVEPRIKLNPRHLKYHHPAKFRNRTVKPTQLIMASEHDILDVPCPKIAVEILEDAIPLSVFQHPREAIYIFGPEDGSVPKHAVSECKEIVSITSKFCLNLAGCVNVVLYDRTSKLGL